MCPVAFGLFGVDPALMICHVLIIETNDGLVLVDTGFGTGDIADPRRLGVGFAGMVRPRLDRAETALAHVERLGFQASDVRHILPTHLDLDHAGGLGDFPKAKVHIFAREVEAALAPRTLPEKNRYRPQHFAHEPAWERYEVEGERWFGFECVRQLRGLPAEILIVPTIGHTRGHSVIAVDDGNGYLVHAGDAYFHRNEMAQQPSCPGPLRLFQRLVAIDNQARLNNQERLRELAREPKVRLFCAHDPVEHQRFAQA